MVAESTTGGQVLVVTTPIPLGYRPSRYPTDPAAISSLRSERPCDAVIPVPSDSGVRGVQGQSAPRVPLLYTGHHAALRRSRPRCRRDRSKRPTLGTALVTERCRPQLQRTNPGCGRPRREAQALPSEPSGGARRVYGLLFGWKLSLPTFLLWFESRLGQWMPGQDIEPPPSPVG